VTEAVLMGWLGYTRQAVTEIVDFAKLEISIVLIAHIFACIWIQIGSSQEDGWVTNFVND
jgi:hypothetical protein